MRGRERERERKRERECERGGERKREKKKKIKEMDIWRHFYVKLKTQMNDRGYFSLAFARSRSRNIRPATLVAKQIEISLFFFSFHYVIRTTACPEIVNLLFEKKGKKLKEKKITRYSRQTTTAKLQPKTKQEKKRKSRCTRRASAY